jgi:hypothetical protein
MRRSTVEASCLQLSAREICTKGTSGPVKSVLSSCTKACIRPTFARPATGTTVRSFATSSGAVIPKPTAQGPARVSRRPSCFTRLVISILKASTAPADARSWLKLAGDDRPPAKPDRTAGGLLRPKPSDAPVQTRAVRIPHSISSAASAVLRSANSRPAAAPYCTSSPSSLDLYPVPKNKAIKPLTTDLEVM